MPTIEMLGVDEYSKKLATLSRKVRTEVIGAAVYDGADVVADAVRAQIEALPTDSGFGTATHPLRGPNQIQKKALLDSFGISRMRDDNGFVNVKLGFSGYNPIKTKLWPKGQPNVVIARSINRGTSWLRATPFIQRAVRASRSRAESIMANVVDQKIYEIMKK